MSAAARSGGCPPGRALPPGRGGLLAALAALAAVVAVAAVASTPLPATAAEDETPILEQNTLAGVRAVAVVLSPFSPAFERGGVTREAVRRRVEGKLAEAGIPTITASAFATDPTAAVLNIGLRANPDGTRLFSYSWSLSVLTKQALDATDSYITRAVWQSGRTGAVIPTELTAFNAQLGVILDQFVADYRAQH